MKIYKLETKKYKWLLYYAIGQIILAIFAQIMSRFTGQTSFLNIASAVLDVFWFLSFPIGAVIAGVISNKLNRPFIFWFIFALFLSPIALIMLSRKSYYVEPDINSIYRKYELKYNNSIIELKNQLKKGKIDLEELIGLKKTKMIELELKMNDEIQAKKKEIYDHINKPIESLQNPIYPDSDDTKVAYNKCPACGTKINPDEIECSECGLRLS